MLEHLWIPCSAFAPDITTKSIMLADGTFPGSLRQENSTLCQHDGHASSGERPAAGELHVGGAPVSPLTEPRGVVVLDAGRGELHGRSSWGLFEVIGAQEAPALIECDSIQVHLVLHAWQLAARGCYCQFPRPNPPPYLTTMDVARRHTRVSPLLGAAETRQRYCVVEQVPGSHCKPGL
jgi:hypothetical protein